MSLLLKIALGVLVVGGLGFGAWNHKQKAMEAEQAAQTNASLNAQAQVKLTTGTSNDDLEKDMASIDSQLKVVNEDSGSIDQSMNDTPTN